jgi:type IV pilus assembly protein PilE
MNKQMSPSKLTAVGSQHARGFTLMELVIAMVIAAVLAAIAIPSYNSYILKSHRTEAKSALLDLASMEERFFSTQNLYSQVPTDLGYTAAIFPVAVGNRFYNINVTAVGAPTTTAPGTYTLQATPINAQVNDTQCAIFQVTQDGVQTAWDSGGAINTQTCWQ